MPDAINPVDQLNELIRGIEFAMLTTVRTDGSLHSCPMATLEADPDGVLWFFSGTKTEKVEAIRTDSRVCLSYADSLAARYVSVTGHAELVRDHAKAKQLWDRSYETWFPAGVESPDLILIRVLVLEASYWNGPEGRMSQIPGFSKNVISNRDYRSASHHEVDYPENKRDFNR